MENNTQSSKSKLTYNDIMNNMGIYEYNNKLYFLDPNKKITTTNPINNPINNPNNDNNKYIHNSYIYNKYFKNIAKDESMQTNKPKNIYEYRNMLVRQIIEKYRINTLKTTKIKIPMDSPLININNSVDENKLFNWIKK